MTKFKDWQIEGLEKYYPRIIDGIWWVGDENTGVIAEGKDGQDGITPHIGDNGNWYFGNRDTGVKAKAEDGVGNQNLQQTTDKGNFTDKDLLVERGGIKGAYSNFGVRYADEQGELGMMLAARDPEAGKILSFGYDKYLAFRLKEQTQMLAGADFKSRVSGHKARNGIDFVTLTQLKSFNPEAPSSPEHSFHRYQDLILATSEMYLNLPEVHTDDFEDWKGTKLRIVSHAGVSLNRPFVDKYGNMEGTNKIEGGESVELMFLQGHWYEV